MIFSAPKESILEEDEEGDNNFTLGPKKASHDSKKHPREQSFG